MFLRGTYPRSERNSGSTTVQEVVRFNRSLSHPTAPAVTQLSFVVSGIEIVQEPGCEKVIEENKIGIGPVNAVEVKAAPLLGGQHKSSDKRALEDVPLDSHHAIIARQDSLGRQRLRLHVHQSQRNSLQSPGDPPSSQNGYRPAPRREADLAAMKQFHCRSPPCLAILNPYVKYSRAFLKELALLGIELRKAVAIHLLIVHLRLGEVRVPGEIGGQTRSDSVLDHFDAHVRGVLECPARLARLHWTLAHGMGKSAQQIGLDPQPQTRLDFFDPAQVSGLRKALQTESPPVPVPIRKLILAANHALQFQAPARAVFLRDTQAFERNSELRDPTGRSNLHRNVPQLVPCHVDAGPLIRDESVVLGSQRIGAEQKSVAVIVKRIEHNTEDVVVLQLTVPSPVRGPDSFSVGIVSNHPHIDRARCVDDPEFRAFRGLHPLLRVPLHKTQ